MHIPIGAGVQVRIPNTNLRLIAQSNYNLGLQSSESFLNHSIGLGVTGSRKGVKKKFKMIQKKKTKNYLLKMMTTTVYK